MGKIASFEEFQKKAKKLAEDEVEGDMPLETPGHSEDASEDHGEHKYYMFFKNISAIKHYISEIEAMDPDKLDALLQNGHDWAADHLATSKDDLAEVAEWVRSEMDGTEGGEKEPENVTVNIEGSDDQVEVGGEEEEEESEPEETEEEGGEEEENEEGEEGESEE